MAKTYFEFNFDEEFLSDMSNMEEQTDEVCEKMLQEAVPILVNSLKATIRSKHYDTGELCNSIKAFEPWKKKDGTWEVNASPTGKTKKLKKTKVTYARSKSGTVSSGTALFNSDKLFYLENGTTTQPAKPVLDTAVKNAESSVFEKMQQIYNEVTKE